MSAISNKKIVSIIAVTWILSLITTLAIVYFIPDTIQIKTSTTEDKEKAENSH